MSRAGSLLALVVVIGLMSGQAAFTREVSSRQATPLAGSPYPVGEMPNAAPVSMMIQNDGKEADRLLGAWSPVADVVVVHQVTMHEGARWMEPAGDGVPIPAGATVILEPERDHLMLVGLRQGLVQGERFPLTLRFARAGEIAVTGRVRRKVDAAGLVPIPPVAAGALTISLISAPPAGQWFGHESEGDDARGDGRTTLVPRTSDRVRAPARD